MAAQKRRHGCLTVFLIFMIVANAALACVVVRDATRAEIPSGAAWMLAAISAFLLFNAVCAVALLKWKKWGFYGLCGSAVFSFIANLSAGSSAGQALGGLVGLAILYGLLHIGKDNKAWPQLQ